MINLSELIIVNVMLLSFAATKRTTLYKEGIQKNPLANNAAFRVTVKFESMHCALL